MTGVDLSRPLIIGFGVVGRAVSRALVARGHRPVVAEDRPTDSAAGEADEIGVDLVAVPSDEQLAELIGGSTVLLPSPGVPDGHHSFALAAEAGLPVRSEFDLARSWDDRALVAITGTNGKTTVTMMVTDALNASGVIAAAVGNTDVPLVEAIDDVSIDVFVVEASSFRLGHSHEFRPSVATWINFAPDHLDAHASAKAYEAAKASIWANLDDDALIVANTDDPVVAANLPAHGRIERFSMTDPTADWHIADGALVGPDGPFVSIDDLNRAQPHDLANGLAVAATAVGAGATIDAAARVITAFAGLPHRLQFVGEWDGISWYNDSKATVPQATEAAVGGFDSVVLIAGGKNKGLSLESLRSTVPPVRHVVAIGDATDEVERAFDGAVDVSTADDMEAAVASAASVAAPGDAVLLSPGCTSFDWYPNYVERGLDFCRIVERLAAS